MIPDWISEDPHYSTGAELADLNQDGWLDLVIADGNDIEKGHLNVYYNNEGSFPTKASWQSDDIGFNGHLDIADVNGDGWSDVAVSYLGTSSSLGPIARLYLNNNGVLSSLPDWNADIIGNAFGVDFGDMNNDGRPDLAVATGWSYSPKHPYNNYVYLNIDGMLSSSPSWISDDTYYYQGVLWVDADNDGWLDLVGTGTGDQIYLYRNIEGMLETTASWNTEEEFYQDGIMLTAGDITGDGVRDLFATDNTQLHGSGLFRQYTGIQNNFFETTHSWSFFGGYGSAVALADVNGDGLLDLATGGWWNPTILFYNQGSSLPESPSWYTEISSVIEKILFADIGPTLENQKTFHKTYSNDENNKLFYLPHQPIQFIKRIICDGVELTATEYTFSREHGWFTIQKDDVQTVEVEYCYSKSLDMIISNWDSGKGNFLYYHQKSFEDLKSTGNLDWTDVKPGSIVYGEILIENGGEEGSFLDWEISSTPDWGIWTITPSQGEDLTPSQGPLSINISLKVPADKNTEFSGDLVVSNTNDQTDKDIIPIILTTSKKNQILLNEVIELIKTRLLKYPLLEDIIYIIRTI